MKNNRRKSALPLFGLFAILVFGLILATVRWNHRAGDVSSAKEKKELAYAQQVLFSKAAFEQVTFGQLLNNQHKFEGRNVKVLAHTTFSTRGQIDSLPRQVWLCRFFCPNDKGHFGNEFLAIRLVGSESDNQPTLDVPVGLKWLYGTWDITPEGEFYLKVIYTEDVAEK